ncbi:hypothetical protein G7Y89_g8235 [Cudoniella acicularis]|uniref:BTB domain-containing protein n=1 Tax=Cudoniella acicularis TaxID=354080 RepID=A0A8H4RH09_9HELO|nr:hypothetical protein G7Y89_g8235 [Cudoniella acicularis]
MAADATSLRVSEIEQNNMSNRDKDVSNKNKRNEGRKSLCPRFLSPTELVTFHVGPEEEVETFIVHKEFACDNSPVLNAAFNGSFVEGQTQTYRIDKDFSIDSFRLLVTWFYSQKLQLDFQRRCYRFEDIVELADLPKEEAFGKLEVHDMALIQLWVLADRLLIPKIQDMVMLELLKIKYGPIRVATTNWINYAYQHTAEQSPLRRLALAHCADRWSDYGLENCPECFPHQLLIEIVTLISNHKPWSLENGIEETYFDDDSCYLIGGDTKNFERKDQDADMEN